jgi:beta-phosphoglucomutase-like phosphatase (HAD superfamily)
LNSYLNETLLYNFQIRELKLQEHFDCIVVSGDLKWEKPQPEIFHRACTSLGVEPFECLMIGDKIETDIVGGFQAELGITIWVPNGEPGEHPPFPPPDFIIPDVSHLIQILQSGKDKAKTRTNLRKAKASSSASSSGAACSSGTSPSASATVASGSAAKVSTAVVAEED